MICYIVESRGSLSLMFNFDQLIVHLHVLRSNGDKYIVYKVDLWKLTVEKVK